VSSVVLQQAFQTVANHGGSGYVHNDGNDTQLKKEQTEKPTHSVSLVTNDYK